MASNSAIVMPLPQCCIAKVHREPEPDIEGTVIYCNVCETSLVYWQGAWRLLESIDLNDWIDFWDRVTEP
jgi:D-arabinose 1-dehydrogenase-like Zn-dependent alcohol dehydrogenase